MSTANASGHRRRRGVVLNGECIQCRRHRLGLTQEMLADVTGLAVRTVATAEGGHLVSFDSAEQICRALGMAWAEVLQERPEEVRARLAAAGYAPAPTPRPWAGRRTETTRVVEALSGGDGPRIVAIAGPPGIGKTSLAQKVAHALAEWFPDGIVWVAAAATLRAEQVARAQVEIADALGFRTLLACAERVSEGGCDRSFRHRLWSRPRLLVLDDLTDPSLASRLAGDASPVRLLVTAASRAVIAELRGTVLELGPLSDEDGLDLLRAHLGDERIAAQRSDAEDLVRALHGMPGRLQVAGRILVREQLTRIGDYRARIEHERPARVHRSLSDAAQRTLDVLSVFGSQAFTPAWAAALAGLPESDVRRHLSELLDRYLLCPATGDPLDPDPWLRLEAPTPGAVRAPVPVAIRSGQS